MPNPLIKGPYSLSRRERPTTGPGEAVVLEARRGLVVLQPSRGLTPGEARFLKGSYWRVSMRSPVQVLTMQAPARGSRDVFDIEVQYVVEVRDPARFYQETNSDIDPLVEIQSKVRGALRAVAATYDATDPAGLQAAIQPGVVELPDYLGISCTDVAVDITDATKARLLAEAEAEDAVNKLRLQAHVDKTNDELEQEKRVRLERHRFELIKGIAADYDLALDPLMLRALALDSDSPELVLGVRQSLANERFEDLRNLGEFFTSLHEHHMLPDEAFAVLMEFAKKTAADGNSGTLRQPSFGATKRQAIEATVVEQPDAGAGDTAKPKT